MTQPYPYDGLSVLSPKLHSSAVVRRQVSQGASGDIGIQIVGPDNGKRVDATSITMKLFIDDDFDEAEHFEDENPLGEEIGAFTLESGIVRVEEGTYSATLTPKHTADRGNLAAVWSYVVNGVSVTYTDRLAIVEHQPTYDGLRDNEKALVEQISWMFADLFDSTNGGPHLAEEFQSGFGYERIAQLMHLSVQRINMTGVPLSRFGVGAGTTQMPTEFQGFLLIGTYLEVLVHLMRSYTEQPNVPGMSVTYTDRRDYVQRWKQIYDIEKRDFDDSLKLAKRKLLGLGRGSLLVAGGIYGSGSGLFKPGTYAAQVRGMRFYPAAPSIAGYR